MIPINENRLLDTIESYQAEILAHVQMARSDLTDWILCKAYKVKSNTYLLTKSQELYLRYLRINLNAIVFANHRCLIHYSRVFDKIIPEHKRKKGSDFTPFKDYLISLMGYEKLRSDKTSPLFPKFFRELGIKVCVYCNSQLTISAEYQNKKVVARFQVDHFIDKASYPCFSISFFNLYPVCASCNSKKGNKEVKFLLYTDEEFKALHSEYKFVLDDVSIAKYRISRKVNNLVITFDDNGHKLDEVFAIEGIYNTQKDLAAEIIVKSEIYNESYKRSLQSSFDKLYGKGKSSMNFSRFIVGNYTEQSEIHNRPMSKFTQDIARQIGLIE